MHVTTLPGKDTRPQDVRSRQGWQRLKHWLRPMIGVLVLLAVFWTGWQGYQDLRQQPQVNWSQFQWYWIPMAIGTYFLGMVPSWLYWHFILNRCDQPVGLRDSFRAFYMSQLGKYVPGKVMVILIRTAVLCHHTIPVEEVSRWRHQHQWITVTATAFMETLTFIAVGGLVGVLSGMFYFRDRPVVLVLALLIALGMCLPILPPVFHRCLGWLPIGGSEQARSIMRKAWGWRTFLLGLAVLPIGWLLLGASLWLLIQSLPGGAVRIDDYPATLTCVSLANVLGFVSLIPGGMGVREIVMYPILEPRFSLAIVIVVLYRLASLTAELLAGGVAWLIPASRPGSVNESSSPEQSES